MSLKIVRTNATEPDFISLVSQLDAYLTVVDGDDHDFYHQYNGIENLKNVVVAYIDNMPIACGALKEFNSSTVEIKRMFVSPHHRGKGIAQLVLSEIESWASAMGYQKLILETGKRQLEAVAFYQKCNYQIISNFGQYIGIDNSLCFEKRI